MITTADVTACLVTRGDQPEMMKRIRESLIFENVIVWDNSERAEDMKCAGRYGAVREATTRAVYFQDDDVIVPRETQLELLDAYEPGVMTAVYAHGENPDGYDDLPLVCGGAIVDRELPWQALERYLERYAYDDAFLYESDFVAGVLYPAFRHLYIRFDIEMPVAQHPSRLCNQPWQRELKLEITERARGIRDETKVAA